MSNASKAMNGGKWITIATVISTLFQFVQVAILARLLSPADFGIVSISNLIIAFFQIFANLGFSNSIIYKQESDRRVLSTLYFLNLIVGIVIFVIIYLSAPYIITFYSEPKLERVVKLASYYFLIVYFGQLYLFLLEKELRFRSVAIIDIAGTVIGSSVTITLAYSGLEELSLIIGSLVMQTVKTVLQVLFGVKFFIPTWFFSLRDIKEHLRFGIFNLGDGLLGFVQSNADTIFIGGMLGVKMLGYYTIAVQLAIFPIGKLNPIILQVAYPILAKMKDNHENLKQSYLKILDFISYCNLPLLAGLYITADSVVPLFYGPGWEQTIGLIKIFVFVGAFTCLSHPLFTLAFTKGKPNLLFYLNLGTLIVKLPLVYFLGTYYQVTGIATAFLLATFLNLVINFVIVHYLIGDFMGVFLNNMAKPLVFCVIMVGAVALYKTLVGYEGLANTIAEVLVGGATYVALTLAYKLSFAEIKAYRQALL
ncbi:MOP flippase family protein [Spirosoma utsteinense]|uniref:PST family polysaccharide transporter/lipopolysaccharide exporter n=1 Tax=Spirosoma utsteinense TaxID=2585773 RepID=A0ABR6VZX1_9BACT|nr:MOP flippase family protein [Spirosoma utsteinense]MBC3786888.1 PST family polysaccharide transporter/lipopolysaccharide exporter [Spirosoma utsteinense]MBC3789815.1 PST family polysaccharide transporter/lipopolysaccharide exporter [Spirosoma utsteinense]